VSVTAPTQRDGADGQAPPVLSVRGLCKRFGGTLALDGVDFDLHAGEVHALLGQNGAGKSTLIKILAGVHRADAGGISIRGRVADPEAGPLPIAFIHQDLGLVDGMTVAENVALATGYPRRFGLIAWGAAREAARAALAEVAHEIDPETRVGDLPAAEKALVAIARGLAIRASVLVLDEPTAALPAADVERLLSALGRLRAKGAAILYVTHRLDEVARIADRVTVLRDGRRVRTVAAAGLAHGDLVLDIVGRALVAEDRAGAPAPGAALLAVEGLCAEGAGPVSFALGAGEVLALVGLRGAGHHAVGRALFGALPCDAGRVTLGGAPLPADGPASAMRRGVGFVSSRRAEESLAATLSLRENLYLNPTATGRPAFALASGAGEEARSRAAVARFSIRPAAPDNPIGTFSGGNQQKAVLARWFEAGSKLLILEEPTIGVDVGAKAEIYALLGAALAQGMGVLLISSDFEEVARLCHRALVFNRGVVAAETSGDALTASSLTALAGGVGADAGMGEPE
jgi:ribose transport system ATP-binding protein